MVIRGARVQHQNWKTLNFATFPDPESSTLPHTLSRATLALIVQNVRQLVSAIAWGDLNPSFSVPFFRVFGEAHCMHTSILLMMLTVLSAEPRITTAAGSGEQGY